MSKIKGGEMNEIAKENICFAGIVLFILFVIWALCLALPDNDPDMKFSDYSCRIVEVSK